MSDLPRSHLLAYGLAAVAVLVLGLRHLGGGGGAGPQEEVAVRGDGAVRIERAAGEKVLVHVAGAVRAPGVYRLRAGARVDDAVRAAGGPTRRAELAAVNLAARLEDGRQVLVPLRARRVAAAAPGTVAAGAPLPGQPLNLNIATPDQLDELDGVGPATAGNIVEFRERNGGFGSVEDLAQVPGIGPKRLAALRELVTV